MEVERRKLIGRDKQDTGVALSCNSMELSSFKEVIITRMVNKFPARYFTLSSLPYNSQLLDTIMNQLNPFHTLSYLSDVPSKRLGLPTDIFNSDTDIAREFK
jgi:hypothetical protein